jgi:hypothetical protein
MVYSTSSRYRVRDFRVNGLSMSQILYCILLHYINTHTRKKIKIKYLHMRIEEVSKQAMKKSRRDKVLHWCVSKIKTEMQLSCRMRLLSLG